jgi:hypothetical protein
MTAKDPLALGDDAFERIYKRLGRRLGKQETDET